MPGEHQDFQKAAATVMSGRGVSDVSNGSGGWITVGGHSSPSIFKKSLCKHRAREQISVCARVSDLSSKLVPRTAQRIKHVLWFSRPSTTTNITPTSTRPATSSSPTALSRVPMQVSQRVYRWCVFLFYSQHETMTDMNACIIWFISGVSAGGVTCRLFRGSALVASVCLSKD